MALILNEEQQSLKDIAKEFLQKNAPVTHFREIRDCLLYTSDAADE